jgi:exonuclease III
MMTSRLPSLVRFVTMAVAASCVGVAVTTAATSQTPAARTPVTPLAASAVDTSVRVVTYNVEGGLAASTTAADLRKIVSASAPDVITLQEMGSPAKRAAVLSALVNCSTCRYDAFMPSTPEQNATPILFRWDTFRLEGTGTKQVSEKTYVGPAGSGPSTLKAKFINYVALRQRSTGRLLYVLNNHAVPSAMAPDGHPNDLTVRVQLYRQHMAGLRDLVTQLKATGAGVVVTGDFNVNYRRDSVVQDRTFPYYNFGLVGLRASYRDLGQPSAGTNGTRLIDYVATVRTGSIAPTGQRVLTGYHSDHNPLQVDLNVAMTAAYGG